MSNESQHLAIESDAPERTQALAEQLGALLEPGIVLALVGRLGAGKTHFVKGLALGTGFPDARKVTSPTFTLIHEYPGRCLLYHIDAYRLAGADELFELGFDELPGGGAVVVEWADRVAEAMPADCLWIEMQVTGVTNRAMEVRATGPMTRRCLAAWASAVR